MLILNVSAPPISIHGISNRTLGVVLASSLPNSGLNMSVISKASSAAGYLKCRKYPTRTYLPPDYKMTFLNGFRLFTTRRLKHTNEVKKMEEKIKKTFLRLRFLQKSTSAIIVKLPPGRGFSSLHIINFLTPNTLKIEFRIDMKLTYRHKKTMEQFQTFHNLREAYHEQTRMGT